MTASLPGRVEIIDLAPLSQGELARRREHHEGLEEAAGSRREVVVIVLVVFHVVVILDRGGPLPQRQDYQGLSLAVALRYLAEHRRSSGS